MKRASAFLALLMFFFAGLAFANTATLTSITGTAQAQTGTAPVRALRVGDIVRQGDTVITGQASSAVLRFEDGQVTALTANSRLQITTYQYNPQTQSGNVLLSLVDGGMRAITGLIGNRTPQNVAYRAATATIGIRGTDITIVTSAGNIVVTVTQGQVSYRIGNGPSVNVAAGQGISTTNAGTTAPAAAAAILAALPANLAAAVSGVTTQLTGALSTAISSAIAVPPAGTPTTTTQIAVVSTPVTGGGSGVLAATCSVSGTTTVCSCPVVAGGSVVLNVSGATATCTLTCSANNSLCSNQTSCSLPGTPCPEGR